MRTLGNSIFLGLLPVAAIFYALTAHFSPDAPPDSKAYPVTARANAEPGIYAADSTRQSQDVDSLADYDLKAGKVAHWKLPKALREISGLAVTGDGRLLAHGDETGVVFEIDYRTGTVVKAFGLSDRNEPIAGDFEGLAVVEDLIYMVTSGGRVYEFGEGADGESVLFSVHATGVGRGCEIEGLAYEPHQRALLLLCKSPRDPAHEGLVRIHRWSVDRKVLISGSHTDVLVSDIAAHFDGKMIHPSGIERHPRSGHYFLVAARQGVIAEITPAGEVVAVSALSAERHRQAEGIAFGPDRTLIIADEGAGKRARLTLYPTDQR